LWLLLWAAGIGPGDEVVVPSFTFVATAGAVAQVGARPVYADIDPASYCITPETVESRIGPKTAAVVAVHLYGHPAPMAGLSDLCRRRGLLLIEDAAQAHGAAEDGRPVGGLGDAGVFSFYPTKNMTTGEGGMVTTADRRLADRVRELRNHGLDEQRRSQVLGTNARMIEMAGAMGRIQLRRLDGWLAGRRANAEWFSHRLADGVGVPSVRRGTEHAWCLYTIRTEDRDQLASHLASVGVGSAVYYEAGCHLHPSLGEPGLELPETQRASAEVLSLPVRPDLTGEERARIAAAVEEGCS
jgi:dTDP-4-amino-4,6-dideoxygalactose transaminase